MQHKKLDIFEIVESAFKIKVNFKGKKRRKLQCPKGMKVNAAGTACVPMSSSQKNHMRLGKRKMVRTVRAGGANLQRKKMRKTKRALRFRKTMGL